MLKFIRNMQTMRNSNNTNIVEDVFISINKKYGFFIEKTRLVITNHNNCPVCKGLGYYIEKTDVLDNFSNFKNKDCNLCTYIIN